MFKEAEGGKMREVSRQRGSPQQKEPQGALRRAGGLHWENWGGCVPEGSRRCVVKWWRRKVTRD